MGAAKDLTGQRFGKLLVKNREPNRGRHRYWAYKCDCGNEGIVSTTALLHRKQVGCGCIMREQAAALGRASATHGHTAGRRSTQIYRCYRAMLARVDYPSQVFYKDYGGRGIGVCSRWRDGDGVRSGFECFVADMGERPLGGTLDRVNNDGNYEPANCRWASTKDQARNRRPVKLDLAAASEIRALYSTGVRQVDLARQFGVSQATVSEVVRGQTWV